MSEFKIGGVFTVEQVRDGKVIDTWEAPNLVVNEGLNYVLDVALHDATKKATWYVGLFEGDYTPVATVTGATIVAAATECTAYTEANRVTWVEAAASSQSITNSASKASFAINATKTLYGMFLISTNTKSDVAGTLFSASRFSASKAVQSGDTLLVTYTVNAASV